MYVTTIGNKLIWAGYSASTTDSGQGTRLRLLIAADIQDPRGP